MADDFTVKDAGSVPRSFRATETGGKLRPHHIIEANGVPVDDDHALPVKIISGGGTGGAGTQYTEDSVPDANPVGPMLLARRRDNLVSEVSADGDAVALNATTKGQLHVRDVDADALLGAVNETAPGADTASSGLNGRLQRLAQQLTTLLARLPSSIGRKVTGNSLSVTLASDEELFTRLGAVDDNPATNTVMDRLKAIVTAITSLSIVGGGAQYAEDSAHVSGHIGTMLLAVQKAVRATLVSTDGDYAPLQVNAQGDLRTDPSAAMAANQVAWLASSANSINANLVYNGACTLKSILLHNKSAATVWLKLWDKGSAAPVPGTDGGVIKHRFEIPPFTSFTKDLPNGFKFANGMGVALTGAVGDTDTTVIAAGAITGLLLEFAT